MFCPLSQAISGGAEEMVILRNASKHSNIHFVLIRLRILSRPVGVIHGLSHGSSTFFSLLDETFRSSSKKLHQSDLLSAANIYDANIWVWR